MAMTRVTSPKNFPETMLFRADSGRYLRVHRETIQRPPAYYVLQLQAFEVDANDNILDSPTGNCSRTSKQPVTIYRTNYTAQFATLQPGWVKEIPPLGVVWSNENLPEGTVIVDALPAEAEDNARCWISSSDQMWRYDAKGELERLMQAHAEQAEAAMLSYEAEQRELL